MASINNGINFLFAGESSLEYGVFIASSVGSTSFISGDENRSLITSKNLFKDIFDLHSVSVDNPLEFEFIIVKSDGSYMDANDERRFKKWLLKNKREWLQIDQEDLSDIAYKIVITQAEKINIAVYNGGLKLHCVADSSHAWSGLRKKIYTTVNGNLSFNFNSVVDFDDYLILPTFVITSLSNSNNITIKNNTTNETVSLSGCSSGEIITLDNSTDKIKTSLNTVIIDRWNKSTLSICEGLNSFSLTGNFKLEMSYRLPIRVGG